MSAERLQLVMRYAGWSDEEIELRLAWFRPFEWRW